MGKSHAPQIYFRRAYVDDPKTFSRYAPMAERILCLVEQTDSVIDIQLNVLRQCVAGTTGSNIGDPRIPEGTATAIISRHYLTALKCISRFDKPLVSRFLEIRRLRMPESSKNEWRERYRGKPEVKLRYKVSYSEYYDNHKEEINRQRRKRWKEQSSDPAVIRKRKRYQHRPDVMAKVRERMRLRNITHRKRLLVESRRNCGKPDYRAWRKIFLRSERYRERVKIRQKLYRECAELLKQLNDPDDPWKRHDAALAFGNRARDYRGASADLIRRLSDPDWKVREALLWALGERREWKAARRIIEMAEEANAARDSKMLINIVTALWKIGTPESMAAAKKFTTYPDKTVSENASRLIKGKPFFMLRDVKSR